MSVTEFIEDRASWLVELFPKIKVSLIFHKAECANIVVIYPKAFDDQVLMSRVVELDSGFKQMFPDEFLVIIDSWSWGNMVPYKIFSGTEHANQ